MIARKLGLPGVTDKALTLSLIKAVEDLRTSLHIVSNLKEFGVKEDEFLEKKHMIAERAVGDACTGSNPRETSVEDMEKILECIYYGKRCNILNFNIVSWPTVDFEYMIKNK